MLNKKIRKFTSDEKGRIARSGNAAGYFCRHFPPEMLAGLGLSPHRICSSDQSSEKEGEKFIRPDACSRCKSIIGGISLGKAPYSNLRLIATLSTCDMMRRTLELISEKFRVPIFQIHLPATRSENSRKFFSSEIVSAANEISLSTNRSFDSEKAVLFYKQRRLCAEKLSGICLSGEISQKVIHPLTSLFNFADPQRFFDFLEEIEGELPRRRIRGKILIAGSPLLDDAIEISGEIEKRGFGVINLTCSGLEQFKTVIDGRPPSGARRNTLAKFAEMYFDATPCMRARPNEEVHRRIDAWVKRTGAAGLIYKTLKFCDIWAVERIRIRQSMGVPILFLDGDLSGAFGESIRTRIDAFLDTVEVRNA